VASQTESRGILSDELFCRVFCPLGGKLWLGASVADDRTYTSELDWLLIPSVALQEPR